MIHESYVRQGLYLQSLPVYERDIPFILQILSTILEAQVQLQVFPNLNTETPITIVDKAVLKK